MRIDLGLPFLQLGEMGHSCFSSKQTSLREGPGRGPASGSGETCRARGSNVGGGSTCVSAHRCKGLTCKRRLC